MSDIMVVTDENYNEVFETGKVLLIAYARGCPDSRRMVEEALPEFLKSAGGPSAAVAVAPVKTLNKPEMENPVLTEWLGIERFPTIYLIMDGRIKEHKPSEGSVDEQIADLTTLNAAMAALPR